MATSDATKQSGCEVKVSIRTTVEKRQEIKAVAAMHGSSAEAWLESLIDGELNRVRPALQALRSASVR